jgi:DedD protein
MAEPADINVDELRRRARRRLVGAVVLALGVAVVVPMLLETEQKPLGDGVSVKIPPVDDGKFVNRLNDAAAKDAAKGAESTKPPIIEDLAKDNVAPASRATTGERPQKYDTRVPDGATTTAPAAAANAPAGVEPPPPRAEAPETPAATGAREPASVPKRAEAAKPAATPAHPPVSVAKAAPMHEGFAVQLAAFADDKGANSLAGRLKKAGYTAYTEPLKTSKGTLWRVRVGPYPSREAAVAARDRLKTEGQSGIVAAIK